MSLHSNMFLITACPSCRLQLLCLVEMESNSEVSESYLISASIFIFQSKGALNEVISHTTAHTVNDTDQFMNYNSTDRDLVYKKQNKKTIYIIQATMCTEPFERVIHFSFLLLHLPFIPMTGLEDMKLPKLQTQGHLIIER